MKNDIIFARKINVLLFMRVKDECFMAVLPPLHVVQQHFIKHSCGLFLAAKSETGTVALRQSSRMQDGTPSVSLALRHKGVAQVLMQTLRKELKNQRVDTLIGLIASNEDAQRFYRNLPNSEIKDEGI